MRTDRNEEHDEQTWETDDVVNVGLFDFKKQGGATQRGKLPTPAHVNDSSMGYRDEYKSSGWI